MRERALALIALVGLAAGGALALAGLQAQADLVWSAVIVVALVPLSVSVARSLARGDIGVDIIALIAMAAALALGEQLAGAVVALMLAGGEALEAAAGRRARRELTALLERAPRVAHRRRGETVEDVGVDEVGAGDVVAVLAGEIVPVDGIVRAPHAVLDESSLTGESLPVRYSDGEPIRSGTANAGEAFDLRATRPAAESAYAALVALVREAARSRAPFVRMADRYAAFFLPVTLATAGLAWALSGDPVRALAVLVVATPCPLILAAPIAIVSGLSRSAKHGVIVKGGGTIEQLAHARTVLFDKTGTLTIGAPEVEAVFALDGYDRDELLRAAASVDQLSAHVLGAALVAAARRRGLALDYPADVRESPGAGIAGTVAGRRVSVGGRAWLEAEDVAGLEAAARAVESAQPGRARVFVAIDGSAAGAIVMADRLRDDAGDVTRRLHDAGVREVALVTGDHADVAAGVARLAGIDRVYAELDPEGKLEVVRAMRARPELRSVVMVGDGVNDAPALALADVGVAMAGAGATISAETADAVIAVDRVDRLVDALLVSRRALRIARQSVVAGMGMSLVAMLVAALGFLTPVAGALLQEGIDVAVILNALRALRG